MELNPQAPPFDNNQNNQQNMDTSPPIADVPNNIEAWLPPHSALINQINEEIVNTNPPRAIVGNMVFYVDGNTSSSVPFVPPRNWVNYYERDPNNNYYTIRINYEYYILSHFKSLDRLVEHLNILNAIGEETINDGGVETEGVVNSIYQIENDIQEIGNISQYPNL